MRIYQITISILFTVSCFLLNSCKEENNRLKELKTYVNVENKIEEKLNSYLENCVRSYDIPGLSIGVVKEGKVVYAKAFGYKNLETKDELTIKNIFHVASVSKPFVATGIMQLVNAGKIGLDSSVVKYLPYFRLSDKEYINITIRQMLCHISGMADVQDYEWDKPKYTEDAIEYYVKSLYSEKMISKPGSTFAYSNMAYECLGDVIAKVSGVSFAEYVKKHILNPSGMLKSTFLKPKSLPKDWASPHVRYTNVKLWEGYPYNRMHAPSSTLHSNIIEMCNWAITNLNRGTFNTNRILDSTSYDLLWKPWFKIEGDNYIGLSWFIGKYRNKIKVSHSGSDVGFSSNFTMIPKESIGVVVLSNFDSTPVEIITNSILDIIFEFEPEIVKIPASISVSKELELNGLNAAVKLWDLLQTNHFEKYDFKPQNFTNLYTALNMDRVSEAESLTRLCIKIFPKEIKEYLKEETETYFRNNPNNKAAPAMLEIIHKEK